ncbi:MAG: HEAT repeat domain-containing protein [Pirellulaceae bacterium]|nr:HEAT repeat domain-containing protein [Pirellulaceae bacterium]
MTALLVLLVCVALPSQACSALGHDDTEMAAVDKLIVMLNQGNPRQKIEAAERLSRIPAAASRSVPALIRRVNDTDLYVRRWAVYALGQLAPASRDATSTLMTLLDHKDFALRTYAAFSICQIGNNSSVHSLPVLIEALWTSDPEVQALAAHFIGEIGPAAKDAVPYLAVVVVFNAVDGVRTWVSMQTISVTPAKSPEDEKLTVAFLRPGESPPTGNVRVCYWDCNGAGSPSDGARRAALIALGKIGPDAKGVTPFLNQTLFDRDEAVRRSARDAWERIHGEELKDLGRWLDQRKQATRVERGN